MEVYIGSGERKPVYAMYIYWAVLVCEMVLGKRYTGYVDAGICADPLGKKTNNQGTVD